MRVAVFTTFLAMLPVSVAKEPHHAMLFQNLKVRASLLTLKPAEVTSLHRHENYYAFLSLKPATISNEVPGHGPRISALDAVDLRTSQGGFELVERNTGAEAANIVVVELLNPDVHPFEFKMGGFVCHQSLYSDRFEVPGLRAYSIMMSPGGFTGKVEQKYDRLLVAGTDTSLREETEGAPAVDIELKAGQVRWLPRGTTDSLKNIGTKPATIFTFELN